MKLWAKGYAMAPLIERYESARNAAYDAELARYDLWGSLAHARMLYQIGLLSGDEWRSMHHALVALLGEAEAGKVHPTAADEDIHTMIESRLVEMAGDVGKKIHTGRSRNDQVLVDMRLYGRDAIIGIALSLIETVEALVTFARENEWVPMPGYTHMQRGMLSSVGLWASAHAEALLDDCVALASAFKQNNQSPLGSGAAYGSPLPLDRPLTASLLGFSSAHHNVLTAANSRGKGEAAIVQALALIMVDLSKFAQDVLLFTTSEYGFFQVPQELCSGSSMMPQKRNLGALEIMRGRAQTVIALQSQMLGTLAGLPSGYNMDYQETKAPLLDAVHICAESLEVVALYASHLSVDEERLRAACTSELFATDRALDLAAHGVPFRDAYRQVALAPMAQENGDLVARLKSRTHEGGTGNLDLAGLTTRIATEHAKWQSKQTKIDDAIADLIALA